MVTDGILPVMNMNPHCNNDGWGNGNGWGALVGGAVGGAVGSAWNGGRWNNGNGPNNNFGDTLLMDAVNNVNSGVQGLQSAICQGFAGTVAAVNSAASQAAQNQSRTEAAVLTTGLQGQIQQKDNTIATLQAQHAAEVQGMRDTFSLMTAQKECCCETNGNIREQGCQTRATVVEEAQKTRELMERLDKEKLLREMCAKDSEIAQLKNQQYTAGLVQASTAAILAKLPATATPAA